MERGEEIIGEVESELFIVICKVAIGPSSQVSGFGDRVSKIFLVGWLNWSPHEELSKFSGWTLSHCHTTRYYKSVDCGSSGGPSSRRSSDCSMCYCFRSLVTACRHHRLWRASLRRLQLASQSARLPSVQEGYTDWSLGTATSTGIDSGVIARYHSRLCLFPRYLRISGSATRRTLGPRPCSSHPGILGWAVSLLLTTSPVL